MTKYTYEILEEGTLNQTILRSDGASIPCDPANSDYQAYLSYVTNGNQVPTLASESQTPPTA